MRREREFSDLRRESSAILSKNGNRLRLMLALIVCLLPLGLYTVVEYAFSAWIAFGGLVAWAAVAASVALQIVLYLLVRLLVSPLLAGLVRMADGICRMEDVPMTELFYGFSSGKRYRCTLRATAYVVRLAYGTVLLTVGTYAVFAALPTRTLGTAILCALLIAVEIVGAVVLSFRAYPMLYWSVRREDLTARELRREVRRNCQAPTGAGARFLIGWIHWVALGILTLGVLLLADVFPRMLVSYCIDCADRAEDNLE